MEKSIFDPSGLRNPLTDFVEKQIRELPPGHHPHSEVGFYSIR